MEIKIASRFAPFSHTPGCACIVPGTLWEIEAFPTLLRVGKVDMRLYIKGPIEGFTLQLDLEKHCVKIFGRAKEGFFSFRFQGEAGGFALFIERAPPEGISTSHKLLERGERLFFPAEIEWRPKEAEMERLSLGSHKKQNWEGMRQRFDLKELLPFLFALGQNLPHLAEEPLKGTGTLLNLSGKRDQVEGELANFLKAAFTKMMIPRLFDDDYQGLSPDDPIEGNRFFLVQKGAEAIRSLFFAQEGDALSFLPLLPPSFHAGRFTGVKVEGVGRLDFEWRKEAVRRAVLRASADREISFTWPKGISSCRWRGKGASRKERRYKKGEKMEVMNGETYLLDCFE